MLPRFIVKRRVKMTDETDRYLTLAPTGVQATLVPTGGGADNRPPGDLENEAS